MTKKLTLKGVWQLISESVTGFNNDKIFKLSGALAYFTIFSIGPMLIVIIFFADLFYGREAVEGTIYGQLRGFVGPGAALQIQDIIKKANLSPKDRLLEIGPGTGKATVQFAKEGFRVHGVESGEDMAAILKEKCLVYPKVSVDITPFEDWHCPDGVRYDLIFSAQSFHWIDKNIKYRKCHELLKDNGHLVLFWYNPCDDKLPATKEIEEKINKIIEKYISNYSANKENAHHRI
jgi:SAM-dependent methyltransferase